ncbi:hypothetical protein A9Q83_04095 [Alphaproteobacteria bacterium 46_93_T64]|nr:hypothetical protein A9Q83_04095 [Alphaproteobacteria bacterium 46_93_T64]
MREIASIIVFVCLLVPSAFAEGMKGTATVLDAVTLQIGAAKFRLQGIGAPKPGQICKNRIGKNYDCGAIAATGLMDLTAGAVVDCRYLDKNLTQKSWARCFADGYDLSKGMVYTGWALPLIKDDPAFASVLNTAKTKKHGLWAGTFSSPVSWSHNAQ